MRGIRDGVAPFATTAAALGAAALIARVACPGQCVTCASCAQSAVPAVAATLAVGSALTGAVFIRKTREVRSETARREDSEG